MQHDKHALSKYRFERAREDIISAAVNIENNQYKTSLNRSYYAIFHGMRAINALDGFDASKHSSVTAHFNQYHVQSGEFERHTYKIIKSAYQLRAQSDYDEFFIASKEDAQAQLEKAKEFLKRIEIFLNKYENS
jgi:uncharacterized protein (UPF0332 family)